MFALIATGVANATWRHPAPELSEVTDAVATRVPFDVQRLTLYPLLLGAPR